MVVSANKRSIMTLYSMPDDPYSHRARIVLAEKGVMHEVIDISTNSKAREELIECNPYTTAPTLIDRDLVLYNSEIIMEYLDERFPHPPLMPVYPVAKGRSRLMIYRINRDWYSLMNKALNFNSNNSQEYSENEANQSSSLTNQSNNEPNKYAMELIDSLISSLPVFSETQFFFSEEFSLVDCCLIPLLWRLPKLKLTLPEQAKPIADYAQRMFMRKSVQNSVTNAERTIQNL